jgi:F-type H+-transporting ATPase subunit delta
LPDRNPLTGVAGRYASALFELAEEEGKLETVERDLGQLLQALGDSRDLADLAASPIYGREAQARAMGAVMEAMDLDGLTRNVVRLMATKGRLFVLVDMIRAFNQLLAKKRGVLEAEVRTPKKLTKAQRANLEGALKQSLGSEVTLRETVDADLIGGLVVKVGSRMIDTSIRTKLNQLQAAMKEAGL